MMSEPCGAILTHNGDSDAPTHFGLKRRHFGMCMVRRKKIKIVLKDFSAGMTCQW